MFCNRGQEGPLKPEKTEVLASKLKERVSFSIILAVTDNISLYFDLNSFLLIDVISAKGSVKRSLQARGWWNRVGK